MRARRERHAPRALRWVAAAIEGVERFASQRTDAPAPGPQPEHLDQVEMKAIIDAAVADYQAAHAADLIALRAEIDQVAADVREFAAWNAITRLDSGPL